MKLTIGMKILLGYVPIVALIFVIVWFTLVRLDQVNRINAESIEVDLVVNQAAEAMIEVLLAQEAYAQRYLILGSDDMLSLFRKRDEEFAGHLRRVENLPMAQRPRVVQALAGLHSDYRSHFEAAIPHRDSSESRPFALADSLRRSAFEAQAQRLRGLAGEFEKRQTESTRRTAKIGRVTFRTLAAISVLGSILAVCIAVAISRDILGSIVTLRAATKLVSQGKFKGLPLVRKPDELGELSNAFGDMAVRLATLEELYVDSSPLTRLPGGIAVEKAVKNHIADGKPYAFCMVDLDNFKPFNDRYGYGRGNAVIKYTAEIVQRCSKQLGTRSDFIGHIGGDDFALITSTDKFKAVCEKIIEEFDRGIAEFYDPDDRKAGCISSKTRRGETVTFPLMTVSVAAIDSEKSQPENHIRVGELIAELKRYAKTFHKSNLVVDRRGPRKSTA